MSLEPYKFTHQAEVMRGSYHNQKHGNVRVGVNMPTDLLERVRRVALDNGFSVAGAMRYLIERGLS
jgi:hypothetical protein